jgi:nucleotide-binding universal stress UspA family protein
VPLDFSRGSMEALDYAVPLAKKFGAAVHLVHVTRPDDASEVPGTGHLMREAAASFELVRGELGAILCLNAARSLSGSSKKRRESGSATAVANLD